MFFLLLLFTSTNIFGQEDLQWLIRDGMMKAPNSTAFENEYSNQGSTSGIKISGVKHPIPPVANPQSPTSNIIFQNSFFAILENGTCANISIKNQDSNNYSFRSNSPIKYLYLTNQYEEDDPPEKVRVDASTSSIGHNFTVYPDDSFLVNQDIIDNRDIILAIPSRNLLDVEDCNNPYRICYDNNLGLDLQQSSFLKNQNISLINIDAGVVNPVAVSKDGDCFEFDILNDKMHFLCLKPTNITDEMVGSSVNINLICSNNANAIASLATQISGKFHDPNFVELKCVWEENSRKWAHYRVECYNEGTASVPVLSIELNLPSAAIPGTARITNYMARCKTRCSQDIININTEKLKVSIPGGVCEYDINKNRCRYTTWFEFCIELDTMTNLNFDPLFVSSPQTTFVNVDYPIVDFIDPSKGKPRQRVNIIKCSNCNCGKKAKPWWKKLFN